MTQDVQGSAASPGSGLEACRSGFEKWASGTVPPFYLDRKDDGEYRDFCARSAWMAWCAARSISEWAMICAACDREGQEIASEEIAVLHRIVESMAKEIASDEGHDLFGKVIERHQEEAQSEPTEGDDE